MALVDSGGPLVSVPENNGIEGKGLLYLVGIWIVACGFVSIYAYIQG
jgi:hypothetical protein